MRASTNLIAVAVTLTVVVVVAALAFTGDEDDAVHPAPVPAGQAAGAGPVIPPPSSPSYYRGLARRARPMIDRDPTLTALLRNNRYALREVAPWAAMGYDTIGVAAMIDPARPLEGEVVFPFLCGGDPAKGGGRTRYRLEGTERLRVLVRFADAKVMQITPQARRLDGRAPARPLEILPGSDRCPPSSD